MVAYLGGADEEVVWCAGGECWGDVPDWCSGPCAPWSVGGGSHARHVPDNVYESRRGEAREGLSRDEPRNPAICDNGFNVTPPTQYGSTSPQ